MIVWPLQSATYSLPSRFPAARCRQHTHTHTHIRAAVFLRCANFSQFESSVRFANHAALFCTRSNAFLCPSLNGSQHAVPHSTIRRTSALQAKLSVLISHILRTRFVTLSVLHVFLAVQLTRPVQLKSLHRITPELLGPVENNRAGLPAGISSDQLPYLTCIYFHPISYSPIPSLPTSSLSTGVLYNTQSSANSPVFDPVFLQISFTYVRYKQKWPE